MKSPITSHALTIDLWLTLAGEIDNLKVKTESPKRSQLRINMTYDLLKRFGEDISYQTLEHAFKSVSKQINSDHAKGTDILFKQRLIEMLHNIDNDLPRRLSPIGISAIATIIDYSFICIPPTLFKGTINALCTLSKLPVKIGLISNTGLTSPVGYRRWFQDLGILDFFHHITFSNGVACAKPDKSIFELTLKELDIRPENAIHIGDNLYSDIWGANQVGMKSIWIKGQNNLEIDANPTYTADGIEAVPTIVKQWLNCRSD